jgi:hypothetical protein
MSKPRTRQEAMKILGEGREQVRALFEGSNQGTGLEVVVVLAVKCDDEATEIDVLTSCHCRDCALFSLEEAHKMVTEDVQVRRSMVPVGTC